MKAMILAAGMGTRLRPLTDDRPKALVTVAGRTLLEIAIARLRGFGVRELIVNTHHYAGMILEYLKAHDNFGMRIEVSREEVLLDTGGGLKNAAHFFLDSRGNLQEPFLVHNVDVMSTIDLGRMIRFHTEHRALATLAVQDRETSRPLLFDELGQFRGRAAGRHTQAGDARAQLAVPAQSLQALAFAGIHVLSLRIFAQLEQEGAFSIIDAYAHLAAQGERIIGFRADGSYWRDLGRPEEVLQAARDLATGLYPAA